MKMFSDLGFRARFFKSFKCKLRRVIYLRTMSWDREMSGRIEICRVAAYLNTWFETDMGAAHLKH